jgi:pyrroloquinoline quinone biosynthesis protein E
VNAAEDHRPYTLIAELTYRCPLRCPYCSNPTDYGRDRSELTTDEWRRILGEAEALGVMQLHFTGGEPLARKDLEALTVRARELELYTNLITSGIPLTRDRLAGLRDAGIDSVQVSVQGVDAEGSDRVAGYACFAEKMRVASWVKELGLPLTINIVLHRDNLDRVGEAIALAERLGADRLELANTQYQGWAHPNRDALLPTEAQLASARAVAAEARARLEGTMELLYVMPDYYSDRPRACMDGWGRRFLHMTPNGTVLPCHAAQSITGLAFESARDHALGDLWERSPAMQKFRGDAWMPEPCRSCPRKAIDFGGCRCQAFALTGDASATDPACSLSPDHGIVQSARARANEAHARRYLYRSAKGTESAPREDPE